MTVFNGQAKLVGAGKASANPLTPQQFGAEGFAASGVLSAGPSTPQQFGADNFAGAGVFTESDFAPIEFGAALLAGAGAAALGSSFSLRAGVDSFTGSGVFTSVAELVAAGVGHNVPTFNWQNSVADASSSVNVTSQAVSTNGNTIVAGDFLLVIIVACAGIGTVGSPPDAGAIVPPSGWTQLTTGSITGNDFVFASDSDRAARTGIFYRIADGTEGSSFTFSWTNGSLLGYAILNYQNVDTISPFDGGTQTNYTGGGPPPVYTTNRIAPAITTAFAYETEILIWTEVGGNTYTLPGTLRSSTLTNSTTKPWVGVADLSIPTPGSQGAQTGTATFTNDQYEAVSFALRAAEPSTYAAAGNFSAGASIPEQFAGSSMAGAGAFVESDFAPTEFGAALLAGSGLFAESDFGPTEFGAANLFGAGALSANGAPPGATTWQGAANFNGAGALAESDFAPTEFGAALFAGAGALAPDTALSVLFAGLSLFAGGSLFAGTAQLLAAANDNFAGAGVFIESDFAPTEFGSATFAGSGAFSALGTLAAQALASFAGSGTFIESDFAPTQFGAALFLGSGAFSESGILLDAAATSFIGAGSFTGVGALLEAAAAVFSGTGAFAESDFAPTQFGLVVFSGNGSFTAIGSLAAASQISFAGAGSLIESDFAPTEFGAAVFVGAGQFSEGGVLLDAAASTFIGFGSFSEVAQLFGAAQTLFAGTGSFAALGSVPEQFGIAAFAGTGTFAAATKSILDAAVASFGGAGLMTPDTALSVRRAAQALFAGAGFFATGLLPPAGSAAFAGAGAFSSVGELAAAALTLFAGAGAFAESDFAPTQFGMAIFTGSGNFAGAGVLLEAAAAIFTGSGNFAESDFAPTEFGAGTFIGAGSLSDTGEMIAVAGASFIGAGAMIPDFALSVLDRAAALFAGSGVLTGVGAPQQFDAPVFQGMGGFAVGPTQALDAAAAIFVGNGSFLLIATEQQEAATQFTGAGALSVGALPAEFGLTNFAGSGVFSENSFLDTAAYVLFDGSGAIIISGEPPAELSAAMFSAIGLFSADPSIFRALRPFLPFIRLLAPTLYARLAPALVPGIVPAMIYNRLALPAPGGGMPQVDDFPTIAPNQEQTMGIDFGKFLPTGVTLTGSPQINIGVNSGLDADPQSHLNGSPIIGTISKSQGGSGITNASVIFQIAQGCVSGVEYTIEAVCDRSDGDIAEGWGILPCQGPS